MSSSRLARLLLDSEFSVVPFWSRSLMNSVLFVSGLACLDCCRILDSYFPVAFCPARVIFSHVSFAVGFWTLSCAILVSFADELCSIRFSSLLFRLMLDSFRHVSSSRLTRLLLDFVPLVSSTRLSHLLLDSGFSLRCWILSRSCHLFAGLIRCWILDSQLCHSSFVP